MIGQGSPGEADEPISRPLIRMNGWSISGTKWRNLAHASFTGVAHPRGQMPIPS